MAYVNNRPKKKRGGLSFYKKEKKLNKFFVMEVASYIFWAAAMILIGFVLVFCFGIKTSVIGSSMEPILYNGQEILINRFVYFLSEPKAGDVVVFLPNGNENSHYYVKRVIAVPGDTVQIVDGIVYVNSEPYEDGNLYDRIDNPGIAGNPIVLGEDEYFVLGDNRNNSEDSRSSNIGVVLKSYIIGKVWFHLGTDSETPGFVK